MTECSWAKLVQGGLCFLSVLIQGQIKRLRKRGSQWVEAKCPVDFQDKFEISSVYFTRSTFSWMVAIFQLDWEEKHLYEMLTEKLLEMRKTPSMINAHLSIQRLSWMGKKYNVFFQVLSQINTLHHDILLNSNWGYNALFCDWIK